MEMKLTTDERKVLKYVNQINGCISEDLYGCWKFTNVEVEGILCSLTRKGLLAKEDEYFYSVYGITEAGRAAL